MTFGMFAEDRGGGLFVQFTSDVPEDAVIPDVAGEAGGAMEADAGLDPAMTEDLAPAAEETER